MIIFHTKTGSCKTCKDEDLGGSFSAVNSSLHKRCEPQLVGLVNAHASQIVKQEVDDFCMVCACGEDEWCVSVVVGQVDIDVTDL